MRILVGSKIAGILYITSLNSLQKSLFIIYKGQAPLSPSHPFGPEARTTSQLILQTYEAVMANMIL